MKMGEESNRLQSDVRIALKGKDGMSARLDDSLRQLAQFQNQVSFPVTATSNTIKLVDGDFFVHSVNAQKRGLGGLHTGRLVDLL